MFLLDTNVISELRKAGDGRADANVVAWLNRHAPETLHISAITLMELEIGVRRIECRDEAQGALLRTWLDTRVGAFFAARTVPVDARVAIQCAKLHVPDQKSERDALIAASAMVHNMAVVTRNVADFFDAGVDIINPWARNSPL